MDEPLGGATDAGAELEAFHADHGAVYEGGDGDRDGDGNGDQGAGGLRAVAHYGRPERTHRAVRNGVGVTETPVDVIVLEGADRVEYLDNVVTNRVPSEDGAGCYSLLLDPQGRVEADLYVYNAGARLLALAPPGVAESIVAGWETFIQDVEIRVATDEFAVFGVHGPGATEKVASVLAGAGAPDERLSFVRGHLGDVGVTVVRTDAPAGETSYDVVCSAADAVTVLDTLVNRGANAVPFGRVTWRTLTLEAGTPLFAPELRGRIPNVLGVRNAVNFEKGCFVGQEVVSKVQNRGRPSRRLVGLRTDVPVDAGAAVREGDASVGEVTRAVESPSLEAPIALALVDYDVNGDADADVDADADGKDDAALSVEAGGEDVPATVQTLPFVEGSERSARIPRYE